MKKIGIWTMSLLAVGAVALTSCDADRDDNPVLTVPSSFNLLKPDMADNVIDLANTTSVEVQAEAAPDFGGFPTETTYWMQVTGEDNKDFSKKDEIYSLSTTSNSTTYNAPAKEVDYCVMQVKGWDDASKVEYGKPVTLNVRLVACPKNLNDSAHYVYSTAQQIKVYPYFIKESLPDFWYLTGGIIADGSWGNDIAKVGTSMIPMYVKKGAEYDKFTGAGVVEYTGYLSQGTFKIIAPAGLTNWNYGIGGGTINSTGGSGFSYRDGGDDPGNISVEKAGYYTLDVNTTEHSLSVTPYKGDVKDYTSMKVGDNDMAPVTTVAGGKNHDWYATVTFDANTELTFTANDGTTWGSAVFPCAISNIGGSKIPVNKGTYKVYFNDIMGAYSFVEQK